MPTTEPPAAISRARELTEAVRALSIMSRRLERAAGGLSLAHYRVLAAVAAGDERASRVAGRLALGKPTISASVESLSARGLLHRGGVSGDQRVIQLSLTDAGRDLLTRAEQAMTADLEALASRTGKPAELVEALVSLGEAIEAARAERRP